MNKTTEQKIEEIHSATTKGFIEDWDWNCFFRIIGIIFVFAFILVGFSKVIFATPYDDWIDKQCLEMNFTFNECVEFRDSPQLQIYNFTDTNTISNETVLIQQTKEELKEELQETREELYDNISVLYSSVANLDFSHYNDSHIISNNYNILSSDIKSLKTQINELTGNSSPNTFDLNQIIETQTQLFVAKETQKQIKEIFDDEDQPKFIDYSQNITNLQNQINNIPKPKNIDLSQYPNEYLVYVLFGSLLIGGLFIFNKLKELEVQTKTQTQTIPIDDIREQTTTSSKIKDLFKKDDSNNNP